MRRSLRVVPRVAERLYNDRSQSSAMCHIMRQDLHTGIMPFTNMHEHVELKVASGDETVVRDAVIDAFAREDGYGGIGETVADFIRRAAQTAVFYGDAYYELILDGLQPSRNTPMSRRDRVDDATRFSVSPIMSETVWNVLNVYVQVAFDKRVQGGPFIFLDRKRTFRVRLPRIYRSEWKRIIGAVIELDRASLSARNPETKGVDYRAALSWLQRSYLLVTNDIPWVHSGLTTEGMSEMHFVYRWLRMRRFMYALRESIVDVMNRILDVAGEAKGFQARIALTNLRSRSEIDKTIQDVLAGRLGPEAIDPFLKSG